MKNKTDKILSKKDDIDTVESSFYSKTDKSEENNPSEYTWEIKTKTLQFKQAIPIAIVISAIIIAAAIVYALPKRAEADVKSSEVVTVSTLKNIVNVSKLSTVKFVYNGSAEVVNDDKTDYYVSYSSTVSVGIDFDKISFTDDSESKKIYASIPTPYITNIAVDIESLDFIFTNKKADKLSVLQTAYEKCIEDVQAECESNDKIIELANSSIGDTVRALTQPIIDEFFDGYELIIQERQ